MEAPIEGMGTYRLVLGTRCHLDQLQTLYVPSFSRNLVYVSKLDVIGLLLRLEMDVSIYLTKIIPLLVQESIWTVYSN